MDGKHFFYKTWNSVANQTVYHHVYVSENDHLVILQNYGHVVHVNIFEMQIFEGKKLKLIVQLYQIYDVCNVYMGSEVYYILYVFVKENI